MTLTPLLSHPTVIVMDKEHFLRLILLAETVSYDGRAAPDCLGSLRKQTRKPTLSQHHIIIIYVLG